MPNILIFFCMFCFCRIWSWWRLMTCQTSSSGKAIEEKSIGVSNVYVFLFCTTPPFNVYISCLSAGFHRFQRNVIRLDGMSQFGKGVSVFIVLWYCWAISIFAHFYFVCPFDIAALIWNIINQNSLNSNSGVFFFHIIFLLKSLFGGILFTLTWVIFS